MKDLKSTQLESLNYKEQKLTPLEEFIESFRDFSKKILARDSEDSNLFIFGGIILVFYGFYYSLAGRYKEQFSSTFLKSSLPVFQTVSQTLNWETLTEIGLREIYPKNKRKNFYPSIFSNSFIETIIINDAANNLNILFRDPWCRIKKQEFVGFFPINSSENYIFQGKKSWLSLSARQISKEVSIDFSSSLLNSTNQQLFLFNNTNEPNDQLIFWYSDDIPSKLESFSKIKMSSFLKGAKKRNKREFSSFKLVQKNFLPLEFFVKNRGKSYHPYETKVFPTLTEIPFAPSSFNSWEDFSLEQPKFASLVAYSEIKANDSGDRCRFNFFGYGGKKRLTKWYGILSKQQKITKKNFFLLRNNSLYFRSFLFHLKDFFKKKSSKIETFPMPFFFNPFEEVFLAKRKRIFFPHRFLSGFLWSDMTRSDIWSLASCFPKEKEISLRKKLQMGIASPFEGIFSGTFFFAEGAPQRHQRYNVTLPGIGDAKARTAGLNTISWNGEAGTKKVDQCFLQLIRISLPANIASRSLNGKGLDLYTSPVLLTYKEFELPVLKFVPTLLEDLNLEVTQLNTHDVERAFNAKKKHQFQSRRSRFWITWLKQGLSLFNDHKLAFYGKALKRFSVAPQIFLTENEISNTKEWVHRMKGVLSIQKDSFFGERKILMGEDAQEREEDEFPSSFLAELEADISPFNSFYGKHFQNRFKVKKSASQEDPIFFQVRISSSRVPFSFSQGRAFPELTSFEWYNFLQSQLELYLFEKENYHLHAQDQFVQSSKYNGFDNTNKELEMHQNRTSSDGEGENTTEKSSLFKNLKIHLPTLAIENVKNSDILTPLNLFNSQPFCMEAFSFIIQQEQEFSLAKYRFDFKPWCVDSLAGLSDRVPFLFGNYCQKATMFKKDEGFLQKFLPFLLFSERWEPITISSWMIFYKFFYIFWIQESIKTLYKHYGREILQSLVSILVALGFDESQVLEFLDLGETEFGLRIIEKSKRRFEDIAGVDCLLPELGETVWLLRTKGNLPVFQTPLQSIHSFQSFEKKCKKCKPPLPFLPKGTLLVGPPGTGKTFIVQAVAGEADVPVLLQSASALMELDSTQSAPESLRKLFQKARGLAPCILFIDEIDTLGSSRENVLSDSLLKDDIAIEPSMESFSAGINSSKKSFSLNSQSSNSQASGALKMPNEEQASNLDQRRLYGQPPGAPPEVLQEYETKANKTKQQLALLMQFLVEMDGLKKLSGVALIGATNRPGVLDPAFVRPGRFEKTLRLDIPNKEKRIALLQYYGSKIGLQKFFYWDLLGDMTAGFTAADIASAMNQSALYSLLNVSFSGSKHSLDTLEAGIESISREKENLSLKSSLLNFNTSSSVSISAEVKIPPLVPLQSAFGNKEMGDLNTNPLEKKQKQKRVSHNERFLHNQNSHQDNLWKDLWRRKFSFFPFNCIVEKHKERCLIGPFAYFKSGKAVLNENLLKSNMLFLSLLNAERDVLQNTRETFLSRFELECNILSLHIGKGSEAFFLGTEEEKLKRNFFQPVSHIFPISMAEGELYTSTIASQNLKKALTLSEISIQSDVFYSEDILLKDLSFLVWKRDKSEIKDSLLRASLIFLSLKDSKNLSQENYLDENVFDYFLYQCYPNSRVPYDLGDPPFGNWYRMYLSDPEQGERNEEWIEPDKIYSAVESLENISSFLYQRKFFLSTKKRNVLHTHLKEKGTLTTQKEMQKLIKDYVYHGLFTNAFDKSYNYLNSKREILDFISDFSLRYQKVRSFELTGLFSKFFSQKNNVICSEKAANSHIQVSSSWGSFSQKPSSYVISRDKMW
jgi:SpoVK/Ycf46/Vps4 family AAA+-type ATPase